MATTEVTREQLVKKKEQLLKSLDEVTKTLKHLDKMVYKGIEFKLSCFKCGGTRGYWDY